MYTSIISQHYIISENQSSCFQYEGRLKYVLHSPASLVTCIVSYFFYTRTHKHTRVNGAYEISPHKIYLITSQATFYLTNHIFTSQTPFNNALRVRAHKHIYLTNHIFTSHDTTDVNV